MADLPIGRSYGELVQAAQMAPMVSLEGGRSTSFFSTPTQDFDPRLLSQSGVLLPDVRAWILSTLYSFWEEKMHYRYPRSWSTVWIAGSGITHQWSAPRALGEPGDLDILVGVEFQEFARLNPQFAGLSEQQMAAKFNQEFHSGLNPETSNHVGFEVTWYVNEGAKDIRDIHPYAAYNVTTGEWTVKPQDFAPGYDALRAFPKQWFDRVQDEGSTAGLIVSAYNYDLGEIQEIMSSGGNEARVTSAIARLRQTIKSASDLFNSIHDDRRKAFGPGGGGYRSYWNFRWQAHKRLGTTPALREIKHLGTEVDALMAGDTYSRDIDPARALFIALRRSGKL